MKTFLKLATLLLPWYFKRLVLQKLFHYQLDSTARIGIAWVFPEKLVMKAGSRIDHFTVAINLDKIVMGENSIIGRSNWITGFPIGSKSLHFKHQQDRKAELILKESAAVTKNHHLDCTNTLEIGRFATIAGYNSQFLTHSIDLIENRQDSSPIVIGDYTFIGTNVVVLGGSVLPSRSVLGAKSLLNKAYYDEGMLYGGVPAKPISRIPEGAKYFNRTVGFVN